MFNINEYSSKLALQFKESRFYSRAVDIQEDIKDIVYDLGQDSLKVLGKLKANQQTLILTGGLLAMGATYATQLLSCMRGQEESSTLVKDCHESIVADGVANTVAAVAGLTILALGVVTRPSWSSHFDR